MQTSKELNFSKVVGFLFLALFSSFMVSNALIQLFSTLIAVVAIIHIVKHQELKNYLCKIPKIALIPLLLFIFSGVLSSVVNITDSKMILKSLNEYKWIFPYFLFGYLLSIYFNKHWLKKSNLLIAIPIIISIYAIWQAFFGMDLITGDHSRVHGSEPLYRSIGTFGMPLTFAYIYGTIFFIYAANLLSMKLKQRAKKLLFITLALVFLAVLCSQTRGAWLAFLITSTICSLFFIKKLRIIVITLILSLPLIYNFAPDNFKSRVNSVVDTKKSGVNEGRILVWEAHFNRFKENPLLGAGMSNYEPYIKQYYEKNNYKSDFYGHAHNTYLHILSAQGLFGILPFLIFHLAFLFLAYKCYTFTDPMSSTIGISSFCTQLYLYIGGLTEAIILDSELNHLLAFIWALTTAVYINHHKNTNYSQE